MRPVVNVAALPVVFWFNVGTSLTAIALNVGLPLDPSGLANTLFCVCDTCENVNAGVVVVVASLVVNSGDKSPALKFVTVPV